MAEPLNVRFKIGMGAPVALASDQRPSLIAGVRDVRFLTWHQSSKLSVSGGFQGRDHPISIASLRGSRKNPSMCD